jgi:hypothetical protein
MDKLPNPDPAPNAAVVLSESVVFGMIASLLRFPFPTVCRHLVAADLLSALEEAGLGIPQELARAVVAADDENALTLLEQFRTKRTADTLRP